MSNQQKSLSFLQKLKEKQASQPAKEEESGPKVATGACPNCGAGRALQQGLTHCAYCGYEFIKASLSDGVHIKKQNNSK